MQIVPKNKWIVIQPKEDAGKIGSIILVGAANGSYKTATVVAVPYPSIDEANYAAGDTVVYDSLGTVEFRSGGETFYMIKAVNVMGVLK